MSVKNNTQLNSTKLLIKQIDQLLPQTQCGLCGYSDGCLPYAHAIVTAQESYHLCVPGEQLVADNIAQLLNKPILSVEVQPQTVSRRIVKTKIADTQNSIQVNRFIDKDNNSINHNSNINHNNSILKNNSIKIKAVIDELSCIGCTKCIDACPVDAIVGSGKLMHTVINDLCTGCELCLPPCPVDCIDLVEEVIEVIELIACNNTVIAHDSNNIQSIDAENIDSSDYYSTEDIFRQQLREKYRHHRKRLKLPNLDGLLLKDFLLDDRLVNNLPVDDLLTNNPILDSSSLDSSSLDSSNLNSSKLINSHLNNRAFISTELGNHSLKSSEVVTELPIHMPSTPVNLIEQMQIKSKIGKLNRELKRYLDLKAVCQQNMRQNQQDTDLINIENKLSEINAQISVMSAQLLQL